VAFELATFRSDFLRPIPLTRQKTERLRGRGGVVASDTWK